MVRGVHGVEAGVGLAHFLTDRADLRLALLLGFGEGMDLIRHFFESRLLLLRLGCRSPLLLLQAQNAAADFRAPDFHLLQHRVIALHAPFDGCAVLQHVDHIAFGLFDGFFGFIDLHIQGRELFGFDLFQSGCLPVLLLGFRNFLLPAKHLFFP